MVVEDRGPGKAVASQFAAEGGRMTADHAARRAAPGPKRGVNVFYGSYAEPPREVLGEVVIRPLEIGQVATLG